MSEQFYALPQEKQLRIINAGLEVFFRNDYRHASTEEIARKAGISKGLLFYYFHQDVVSAGHRGVSGMFFADRLQPV